LINLGLINKFLCKFGRSHILLKIKFNIFSLGLKNKNFGVGNTIQLKVPPTNNLRKIKIKFNIFSLGLKNKNFGVGNTIQLKVPPTKTTKKERIIRGIKKCIFFILFNNKLLFFFLMKERKKVEDYIIL